MRPGHAEYQAFLHPACEPETKPYRWSPSRDGRRRTDLSGTLKSAQRESNPRFLHGKQIGYRYIMGALWCAELSKIGELVVTSSRSTGRDLNPRHRITGAVSLPLDDQCNQSPQWDQTDLNRHHPG